MAFHLVAWRPLTIFACLTLATAICSPVNASVQGKQFRDWGGNCELAPNNQPLCYLEQVLHHNGNLAMVSLIGYPPNSTTPTAIFELPAGIHVTAGFSLQVERHAPIKFNGNCNERRCSGVLILTPPILEQFKRGRNAILRYTPTPNAAVLEMPVSLMGVTAGLAALSKP